ncbi:hypothetical protein Hanom_Chr15g01403161 [Helianthus anomalus]
MAGSLNALREELDYMRASNVNVSNFVSMKLSGGNNYKIWKAQILCLVESQKLLHIIRGEFDIPEGVDMISQYDKLVKGWIFGSVHEKVLKNLVDLCTAQEVWTKLESLFNPPVMFLQLHQFFCAISKDLKYIQALNANLSNFVSEKLGYYNYPTWKTEMLCLITSHELLHIIHAEFRFPEDGDPMTQKYDNLVKGWILSTMSDQVHHMFRIYRSVQLLWRNLESYFTYQPEIECWQGGPSNETEELKCRGASNVNVSNFVSVKLSGLGNYYIWKAQMLCLIERHDLLRLLHGNDDLFEGKYDKLVRDWILSTLDDTRNRYKIYG